MMANREEDPISQEFDLLASIFCLDGESCDVKTTFPNPVISITQRVGENPLENNDHDHAVNKNENCTLCLSFDLPPEYPLVCPSVSVQCSHIGFTRNSTSKLSDLLKNEALTLIGEPMLLQLCQSAKTHVAEIISNATASDSSAKNKIDDDSEEKCLTILEIDHMRNKMGYFKTISKWADQLSLKLLLIQLLFRKRKQFLILIWGFDDDIKIFLKNLKAQAVDVDSTGKPCKERLVSVLCSLSVGVDFDFSSLSKGVTFEEIESEVQLKTFLNRYKLSQVYDEYVDC